MDLLVQWSLWATNSFKIITGTILIFSMEWDIMISSSKIKRCRLQRMPLPTNTWIIETFWMKSLAAILEELMPCINRIEMLEWLTFSNKIQHRLEFMIRWGTLTRIQMLLNMIWWIKAVSIIKSPLKSQVLSRLKLLAIRAWIIHMELKRMSE